MHKKSHCSSHLVLPVMFSLIPPPLQVLKRCRVSPGGLGAGLHEGVSKQSDGSVDRLVDPGVVLLSEVSHLPGQGLPPVHQVLEGQGQTRDNAGSDSATPRRGILCTSGGSFANEPVLIPHH